MNGRAAFTLVELLVVIAILSILAALLFPSLKQARHQALLTTCLSNLRQNGVAVLGYTGDHDGLFPTRWDHTPDIGTANAATLAQLGPSQNHDLRVDLGPYTEYEKTFLCPLVEPVDLTLVVPRIEVDCSYAMWFGWPPEFRNSPGLESSPGMEGRLRRLNDEFIFRGRPFKILISDLEWIDNVTSQTVTTHPALGVTTKSYADGQFIGSNQRIFSFYFGVETRDTEFNLNFMFTDGHAELIRRMKRRRDTRFIEVPTHWGRIESLLPVRR
jgi:prepilin-type N-terminal cleavage/methylation domain-containing protein